MYIHICAADHIDQQLKEQLDYRLSTNSTVYMFTQCTVYCTLETINVQYVYCTQYCTVRVLYTTVFLYHCNAANVTNHQRPFKMTWSYFGG